MFAATGDPRFKERADYIVKEMKEVQDKNGDGYLGAVDGLREKFAEVAKGNIKSTFFDLNGLWSPWYTLHKTYAGLRDAYRDRKSTRLNSSHSQISYAVFCLKKKKKKNRK